MGEYLPLQHPWASSLFACVAAAVLEGVLSGTKVKQRFAELRLPQPTLPTWAWGIIGAAYYLLFFLVLTSILGSPSVPRWTAVALVLMAVLLAANALWNWVFFRKKDLWLSLVYFVPYTLVAIALAFVLFHLRNPFATSYLLYLGYLPYAAWWAFRIWRLNAFTERAENPKE